MGIASLHPSYKPYVFAFISASSSSRQSLSAPFEFTGRLLRVTVDMHEDQKLDGDGVGAAEMARR